MKYSEIKLPSNKRFGFFFSFVFLMLSLYYFIYFNYLFFLFFGLFFVFILLSFFKPNSLYNINRIWMTFGFLLGKIISPIIMGFIFFLIFTPISLIMKIIGRDELNIKFNQTSTYWKKSSNSIHSNNFNKQY